MSNDTQTLDAEIDALAADIEQTIAATKEINDEYSDSFDHKHRRMAEADPSNIDLFGDN